MDIDEVGQDAVGGQDDQCSHIPVDVRGSCLQDEVADYGHKSNQEYVRGNAIKSKAGLASPEVLIVLAEGLALTSSIAVGNAC